IKHQPNNADVVYLLKNNPSQKIAEFWKSTNKGETWARMSAGWLNPLENDTLNNYDGGGKLAVTAANPHCVYALLLGQYHDGNVNDNNFLGIFKSSDKGETWAVPCGQIGGPYSGEHFCPVSFGNTSTIYPNTTPAYEQGYYNLAFGVSQTQENTLWLGFLNLLKSNNAGATLAHIGGYVGGDGKQHADIQDIDILGNDIWVCSDGGINLYNENSNTHEARNKGINASEFWGFGSGWNEDILVGGRYHNGNAAWYQDYPNGTYLKLGGGEAATGYVFPSTQRKTFYSDLGGRILPKTLTETVNSFYFSKYPNETPYNEGQSKVAFHPHCYNHLFLGNKHQLWQSTDGGVDFSLLYTFGNDNTHIVLGIEIARNNPKVMYVLQKNGKGTSLALWRTNNGGISWTSLNLPLEPSESGYISLNPSDENELWLAFSKGGNSLNKVFKTENGGETWLNFSSNTLDGHYIEYLVTQGGTNSGVYLATDKTIFYRNNSHNDWKFWGHSLPLKFNTLQLAPFYKTGKIRAATFNRGIWEAEMYEPSKPVAQPMADKLTVNCSRDTVYFEDYSMLARAGATWSWSISPQPAYLSDANSPYPKAVFDKNGDYSVFLFVRDSLGNQDMITVPKMISVQNNCEPDTVAGAAVELQGGSSYLYTPPIEMETTASLSLSAWVNPSVLQANAVGILTTQSCGITLVNGNRLGYYWAANPQSYLWNSEAFLPINEWSQVTLVIYPDSAILYLNGVPHKRMGTNLHSPLPFSSEFYLGNDNGNLNRTFTGVLDEVCIYSRALSQAEVREMRHFTRNYPTKDESLLAYYQFNESSGKVLDHVHNAHAQWAGAASRILSSAPVGSGVSDRQWIDVGGLKKFLKTQVNIDFPISGILPDGEIIVNQIFSRPDYAAGLYSIPEKQYYIINNYGKNATFSPLNSLTFGGLSIAGSTANDVANFKLFKRKENATGNVWGSAIDLADALTAGSGNANITFSNSSSLNSFGQFQISTSINLPVNLQYFQANLIDGQVVKLNWGVNKEQNVDYYEVERRSTSTTFQPLTQVKVIQNSDSAKTYTLYDETPFVGLNEYQLKWVDKDGTTRYSLPEKVWVNGYKDFEVFPTLIPENQTITIRTLSDFPYLFTLYDTNGKVYVRQDLEGTISLELPALAAGIYLYRINGNGVLSFGKLVVE
ncbi:MAG: LamG-like jellyroll fold domain-containing protein, partial [Bacteroidia bacterium]